jgi:hypothetical protein
MKKFDCLSIDFVFNLLQVGEVTRENKLPLRAIGPG